MLFHISLFFNTATTLSGAEVCMKVNLYYFSVILKKEVFIGQIRESLTKHVCVSFFRILDFSIISVVNNAFQAF